jgi:hypothetical protein
MRGSGEDEDAGNSSEKRRDQSDAKESKSNRKAKAKA